MTNSLYSSIFSICYTKNVSFLRFGWMSWRSNISGMGVDEWVRRCPVQLPAHAAGGARRGRSASPHTHKVTFTPGSSVMLMSVGF